VIAQRHQRKIVAIASPPPSFVPQEYSPGRTSGGRLLSAAARAARPPIAIGVCGQVLRLPGRMTYTV